jgi:pyruvate/2-oxoglutarate dehydrogenase complex dihydrolipoamide acyltransferase (E2) component
LAQIRDTSDNLPVGAPLVVVVKKSDAVKDFQSYKFSENPSDAPAQTTSTTSSPEVETKKSSPSKNYPKHDILK